MGKILWSGERKLMSGEFSRQLTNKQQATFAVSLELAISILTLLFAYC